MNTTSKLCWSELVLQGRRRIERVFKFTSQMPQCLLISEIYFAEISTMATASAASYPMAPIGERDIQRYYVEQFCRSTFGVDRVRFANWIEDTFAVPQRWVIP